MKKNPQSKRRFKAGRDRPRDEAKSVETSESRGEPDWQGRCDNCGASPTVPETGLCGPCTFGESETAGGNW